MIAFMITSASPAPIDFGGDECGNKFADDRVAIRRGEFGNDRVGHDKIRKLHGFLMAAAGKIRPGTKTLNAGYSPGVLAVAEAFLVRCHLMLHFVERLVDAAVKIFAGMVGDEPVVVLGIDDDFSAFLLGIRAVENDLDGLNGIVKLRQPADFFFGIFADGGCDIQMPR